jgi:outer membrane protein assembly factor BamB
MGRWSIALVVIFFAAAVAGADDWPMYGRDRTRNAVSPEKGAPLDWQWTSDQRDPKKPPVTRNILWSVKLGSRSLGGPIVSNGLVWVGTNSHITRNEPRSKDMAVLLCLRERDGKEVWRYESARLPDFVQDGPWHSMGTPLVAGHRLYLITNRCETIAFDIGPLVRGDGVPKILWKVDMRDRLGVYPQSDLMASGFCRSPAIDSERVFAGTSNGVDDSHLKVPAPMAPSLVCFQQDSGKILWQDASPGKNIMHSQRSSPLVADIGGNTHVIIGQGDGWLRSFDAKTSRLIWKCDLNPKGLKYEIGGNCRKNYVMATPVLADNRIYIGPGQSPENYEGESELFCIDPNGAGDVSAELDDGNGKGKPNPNSHVIWRYGGPDKRPGAKREFLFGRTLANCTVAGGLVYATDIGGFLYCIDAKTGKYYWDHDLKSEAWTTPLWVDGKIYVATMDGDVWIFAHGREKKVLKTIAMDDPILAAPIFANGVLYVMTESWLHAIKPTK